jgi:hypothetical protein
VARLAGLVPPGRAALDAAFGTGQYWPALLVAGLEITGTGQSAAMLAHAHRKYPEVPARVLALQDLAVRPGPFNALLCVDALEYVAPGDWPAVVAGFGRRLPRRPAPARCPRLARRGRLQHRRPSRRRGLLAPAAHPGEPRPVRSARIPSSGRPVARAPAIPSRAPPL